MSLFHTEKVPEHHHSLDLRPSATGHFSLLLYYLSQNMHSSILLLLSLALGANSYPWAAELGGNDVESLVEEHHRSLDVRSATCPTHLTRKGAAPYSNLYPSAYTGAKNGLPGTGKGGLAAKISPAYRQLPLMPPRGSCPGFWRYGP